MTGKGSRHASITSLSSDFTTKDTHPRVFLPVTQFPQNGEMEWMMKNDINESEQIWGLKKRSGLRVREGKGAEGLNFIKKWTF